MHSHTLAHTDQPIVRAPSASCGQAENKVGLHTPRSPLLAVSLGGADSKAAALPDTGSLSYRTSTSGVAPTATDLRG